MTRQAIMKAAREIDLVEDKYPAASMAIYLYETVCFVYQLVAPCLFAS